MMKKIIFIFLIVCISCNTKNKQSDLCINKITYTSQKKSLVPSIIEIKIEGDNGQILKKIENNELKKVILFSIKEEYRNYFIVLKSFKKHKNPITVTLVTGFFDAKRSFKTEDDWKHDWKQKEIENAISGDIGLVFGKDTIKIKMCK